MRHGTTYGRWSEFVSSYLECVSYVATVGHGIMGVEREPRKMQRNERMQLG